LNLRRAFLAILLSLSAPLSISAAAPDSPQSLNWYRCNTHTHTSARPGSDANESPDFVAQWYRSHGYQCLVITDHENFTDVAPVNAKYATDGHFLVIPGQEITQTLPDPTHLGGVRHLHINGINTDKLILPLTAPVGMPPSEIYERNIAAIRAAGGIPQINHPNLLWSVRPEDLLPLKEPFLLEIWNAFPTSNNLGGVDSAGHQSLSTEALWDRLLTKGQRIWGVASDDAHAYHSFDDRESPTPGKGWIVVQAPSLSVQNIVTALRAGRFYASTGIALARYSVDSHGISIQIAQSHEWSPALKPSALYTTRFIGANGDLLAEITGLSPQYRFKGDEPYVRASIMDSDGRRAWTQPVFRLTRP
jgi:hypothetical protein